MLARDCTYSASIQDLEMTKFELPLEKQYLLNVYQLLGPVIVAYLTEMQTLTPRAISIGNKGPKKKYFIDNDDRETFMKIKNGIGRDKSSFSLDALFKNLLAQGKNLTYKPNEGRTHWSFQPNVLEPPGFRVSENGSF